MAQGAVKLFVFFSQRFRHLCQALGSWPRISSKGFSTCAASSQAVSTLYQAGWVRGGGDDALLVRVHAHRPALALFLQKLVDAGEELLAQRFQLESQVGGLSHHVVQGGVFTGRQYTLRGAQQPAQARRRWVRPARAAAAPYPIGWPGS